MRIHLKNAWIRIQEFLDEFKDGFCLKRRVEAEGTVIQSPVQPRVVTNTNYTNVIVMSAYDLLSLLSVF